MIKTVRSVRNQNILIAGCGYVGQRLAEVLPQSATITGLVRTPQTARQLGTKGVSPLILDLDQTMTLPSHDWQQIYYFAPPPRQGQQDTRMTHFLRALDNNNQVSRLVYPEAGASI